MKNKKTIVGLALAVMMLGTGIMETASASYVATYYNLCSLGIYPYKEGGTYAAPNNTSSINLHDGDSLCSSHLTYPGQYSPQPPQPDPTDPGIKIKPGYDNYFQPDVWHAHTFWNSTSEDTSGSPQFYYKSYLAKFQITLKGDALTNTDLSKLSCFTPDETGGQIETPGCDTGGATLNGGTTGSSPIPGKPWGGTTINFNSGTGVITWSFGSSGSHTGKPRLWGNNPSLGLVNGHWGATVKLTRKSGVADLTSATTTMRALVRNDAIQKGTGDNNTNSYCAGDGAPGNSPNYNGKWCTIPGSPPIAGVEGTEVYYGQEYYWYRGGIVASLWQKPTPPGPPECSDLILKPIALMDTGATPMTAQVVVSDGSVHTAHLLWTPTGGTMSLGNTQTGNTGTTVTAQKIANTYNLADPNVGGSVKAKVTSIDGGVVIPLGGTCDKGVEVKTPPITPDCTGLSISPAGPFTEMDIPTSTPGKTITVTSSTKGGLVLSYKWQSSVPGLIKFDGNPGTYIDLNKTTDLTRTGSIPSPGGVTVTVTGVNASNTAQDFAPLCKKTIKINPPPKPYCEYITPSKLTLSNTSSDTFSATVHYNDGVDRNTEVTWTPTNLNLTPATNPETHNSAVPFTKNTNPQIPGSLVALNAKVTKVPAGVDNSPACQTGVTASSGGGNECQSLNNSGYTGTTVVGGSAPVLLAPNPTNVNPPPPPQVTWTVSGSGWLVRNNAAPFPFNQDWMCPATLMNTSESLPRGCQYWYYTTGNSSDSGFVSITANPNLGNKQACTQTTSFNNTPNNNNQCTGLSWNLQPSGQLCVSPIGTFNGQYQWTVGGSTFTNGNCQNVPPNTAIHVEGVGAPQCSVNIPPQQNQCNYVTPTYNGSQLCLVVNGAYAGPFTWQINGGAQFSNGLCQNVAPNSTVNVIGPNPACSLTNYKTPPNPPKFEKSVRALNTPEQSQGSKSGSTPLTLSPKIEGKIVEYTLKFTPASASPTTVTITDDISKGYILDTINTAYATRGKIVYNDNMTVSVPFCGTGKFALTSNCYTGDIGTPAGVTLLKVSGPVTITYQGKVTGSLLTDENCKDSASAICQEKYPNMASANYAVYPDVSSTTPTTTGLLNANAIVQSFCQYILTRAAGDIYLETDLNFGKDIYRCTDYKSSTGLIVTPGPEIPPGAPSTGPGTVPIGHEVCSQGLTIKPGGSPQKVYGEDAASKYLSSQICEVKLRPGESWSKSTITSTIQENKTRVSRWEPNLDTSGINTIGSLDDASLPASNTGVYHITNGNLIMGNGSDLILHDGQGAKTFIVEGHDLVIKNNIKYGDCNKPSGVCTVRDTASLAFIVLGGNVIIDPGVTEVSGVFFVQQGSDPDSGKLMSLGSGDSFTKLTIFGSVYGDIQDLFSHHKFAGDPAANEGSVVIRFDERIILNTPPGLQDILQLSQSEVAR